MKAVFLAFLAAHFVADYFLQLDWIAVNKAKGKFAPHFIVVALANFSLVLLPVFGAKSGVLTAIACVTGNVLSHYGVDFLKQRLLSSGRLRDGWFTFTADQLLHFFFLFLFSLSMKGYGSFFAPYAPIFRFVFLISAASDGAEIFFFYYAPLLRMVPSWKSPSEYFSPGFRRWYEYFEGLFFLLLVWQKWYYLVLVEMGAKYLFLKRFSKKSVVVGVWGSVFRFGFVFLCFAVSYYLT